MPETTTNDRREDVTPDVHLYCDYWASVLNMRGVVSDSVYGCPLIVPASEETMIDLGEVLCEAVR